MSRPLIGMSERGSRHERLVAAQSGRPLNVAISRLRGLLCRAVPAPARALTAGAPPVGRVVALRSTIALNELDDVSVAVIIRRSHYPIVPKLRLDGHLIRGMCGRQQR